MFVRLVMIYTDFQIWISQSSSRPGLIAVSANCLLIWFASGKGILLKKNFIFVLGTMFCHNFSSKIHKNVDYSPYSNSVNNVFLF